MKNILIRIMAASAVFAGLVACNKDVEQPPMPELSANVSTLEIGMDGATTPITVYSNRSFSIECDENWLAFDPSSVEVEPGEVAEYTINVTALPTNVGDVRTSEFSIKTLTHHVEVTVTQEADPDMMPLDIYANDFDKEVAVETNDRWPLLDTFNGWRNETGSGVTDGLTYYGSGVSIRANSASNGSHSVYEGSGSNNLFFGSGANFAVGNIALHQDHRGLILTFGSERYVYNESDNTFNPDEFPVWISVDGTNWVEVEYSFPGGVWQDGTWDLATAEFTLPEQASAIWIRFAPTLASAYRLDDVTLTASPDPVGETIDWDSATTIDPGTPIAAE